MSLSLLFSPERGDLGMLDPIEDLERSVAGWLSLEDQRGDGRPCRT